MGLSYSESSDLPSCPFYCWSIPAILDVIATVAANTSLIYVNAATARMLFACNILMTVGIRRFWMLRSPTIYEIVGVGFVMAGVVLAGVSAIFQDDSKNNYGGREWLGVLMALVTVIFSSMNFISQEYIFSRYNSSTLEAACFICLFGTIIDSIILPVAHVIGYEDVKGTFYQMTSGQEGSKTLIITHVIQFLAMAIFTISSAVVLKIGSSVLRGVVNTGRTAALWMLQLILGKPFMVLTAVAMMSIIVGVTSYHYNYIVKENSWRCDEILRKELNCCSPKDQTPPKASSSYEASDASLNSEVSQKKKSKISEKNVSKVLNYKASDASSDSQSFHKALDCQAPEKDLGTQVTREPEDSAKP